MGRSLSGSVVTKGSGVEASVPSLDRKRRVSVRFSDETEAWKWVNAQVERLNQGLEPVRPAGRRRGRPGRAERVARAAAARQAGAPSLEAVGRRWHAERYVALERGDAQRAKDVLDDLETHLFTPFADLLACDLEVGRARVIDWLRVMAGKAPIDEDFGYRPMRQATYAQRTVSGYLWLLSQVLEFARTLGHDVPDFTRGVHPLRPVGRKKKVTPFVSIGRTLAVAAHLHIVHQAVLWLLRLAGMRISEAFGLRVANFFVDQDGDGFLVVKAQGGPATLKRDDDGEVRRVRRKEHGKTDAAYRLIALPQQLTELLQVVVGAYHTRPDGTVDMEARLVPAIRAAEGGQEGFRSALAKAARLTGTPEDPEAFGPHGLRKGFATDLAWDEEVGDLVARRLVGHRAGSDVFSLVYTLDTRLKAHLSPAARAVERLVVAEVEGASIMVTTTARPLYAKDADVARADAVLEEAGWQVRRASGLVDVAEAAALLGRAESTTRRLMGKWFPATKGERGEWLALLDDVLAFRERLDGHELLCEVAERAGLTYHQAYQLMTRLGIDPDTDPYSRTLLLSDEDARRVVEEAERLAALRARAMPVAEAAAELGVAVSTARCFIGRGLLVEDPETDARGTRYVSRVSVADERARRRGRRR